MLFVDDYRHFRVSSHAVRASDLGIFTSSNEIISPSLMSLLNVAFAISPIGILSLLTLIGIASPRIVKPPVALSFFLLLTLKRIVVAYEYYLPYLLI